MNIKLNITRILQIVLLFTSFILSGQENWKIERNEDEIEVYTSKSTSKYKAFKGHTIIDTSVQSFVAFLNDIDEYVNWGYKLSEASLIKRSGDTIQIYQAIAQVPFPYKNREGIYHNSFKWNSETKTLFVKINTLDDYKDQNKDYVRIQGKGFWKVMVLPSGKLDVTFQMQIDPGGSIPTWLVNMFVDNTPYYTLLNLKKLINNKKYQNKTYSFIK
jgi:hypothetical protein